MVQFGEYLKTSSLRSNSVTRQVILIGQKLVEMPTLKNINSTLRLILKECEKGSRVVVMKSKFENWGLSIILVWVWQQLTIAVLLPDCSCKSHALSLPSSRVTSVHPQLLLPLLPSTTRHHKENLESTVFFTFRIENEIAREREPNG